MSDYNIISTLNKEHKVYLVQSPLSNRIYVQKILDVYNIRVYEHLYNNPIPGIPQIINYYEQNNQLIVIEEYISGTSLQEKIDNSELSVADINNYMLMLCNILEALHALTPAIIHRDIKPSNIIITSYNYAILLDFNAAKQFSDSANSDTILLGTPGYAAPEQYGFGSSSPQTDIYALGIVLKEMLGSLRYPNSNLLNYYERVVKKCTEMTPSSRYSSVAELKEALISITPSNTSKTGSGKTSLIPPGFRSKTPWKMLLASIGYLLLIYFSLTLQVENMYGGALWVERIFSLFVFLTPVLCGCNYMDIQNIIPLCKNKKPLLHYSGIVLLDAAIIFSLLVVMIIVEAVFFPK